MCYDSDMLAGCTGGRTGGPPAAGVCDDGWTAVSRPPKSNIVDPSRLRLSKREQVDDNIQLGPGGRGMGMGWHRGSSGGGKQSAASQDIELRQPNRFYTGHTHRPHTDIVNPLSPEHLGHGLAPR